MRALHILLLLSLTACAEPMTNVRVDGGPAHDALGSTACDPHAAPCRVTLTCTHPSGCEALDLASGAVRPDEPMGSGDVRSYLGRYLTLSASETFCRFGTSPGTSTTAFASLTDIPADPALCSWMEGAHLLCGVDSSGGYTPSCLGWGVLVRDTADQLYRLRIIADRVDESGYHLDVEWAAVDG